MPNAQTQNLSGLPIYEVSNAILNRWPFGGLRNFYILFRYLLYRLLTLLFLMSLHSFFFSFCSFPCAFFCLPQCRFCRISLSFFLIDHSDSLLNRALSWANNACRTCHILSPSYLNCFSRIWRFNLWFLRFLRLLRCCLLIWLLLLLDNSHRWWRVYFRLDLRSDFWPWFWHSRI